MPPTASSDELLHGGLLSGGVVRVVRRARQTMRTIDHGAAASRPRRAPRGGGCPPRWWRGRCTSATLACGARLHVELGAELVDGVGELRRAGPRCRPRAARGSCDQPRWFPFTVAMSSLRPSMASSGFGGRSGGDLVLADEAGDGRRDEQHERDDQRGEPGVDDQGEGEDRGGDRGSRARRRPAGRRR